MSKRELPEADKLTYNQVNLELQSSQQSNIYFAMICDRLRHTNHLLRIIVILLAVFLFYIMVDRFIFPNAGLFHAGG